MRVLSAIGASSAEKMPFLGAPALLWGALFLLGRLGGEEYRRPPSGGARYNAEKTPEKIGKKGYPEFPLNQDKKNNSLIFK